MELWELTAREQIRDTLAQYSHAGDAFRLHELAAAFCEDGVLAIRGFDDVVGRAAIVERLGGRADADDEAVRTARRSSRSSHAAPMIVRHDVTNIRFELLAPDEAVVASYFTVFTQIGLDHHGRYRDQLVPVGDRWLIARRTVSVDWRAADSIYS
jgi:SnoaL-like domain